MSFRGVPLRCAKVTATNPLILS
jgi:hypothetical protein